jgi:hypothetical protein
MEIMLSAVQFVTDGIESAVNQAKAAAARKSVAVHGADTIHYARCRSGAPIIIEPRKSLLRNS